jgi:TRAP-type uncharacterized transport system substrate-binding protein
MGTSRIGTVGYMMAVYLSDIIRRELKYDVYVYPYPGSTENLKAHLAGDLEMSYAADVQFADIYSNGRLFGVFVGALDTAKKHPAAALWLYPFWNHILVPATKAGEYRCWSDLNGKKGFLTPKVFMNHIHALGALRVLGINVTHVELPTSGPKVKEAFDRGEIDFMLSYTPGASLAAWVSELEMLMDFAPVNLCPHEIEKLKAAGYVVVTFNASTVGYKRNARMGMVTGISQFVGWAVSEDVPEEYVYNMLVVIEKNIKTYVSIVPEFTVASKDFAKFNADATASIVKFNVPIHPGLARYLKEKGLWNPDWDPLILKPKA